MDNIKRKSVRIGTLYMPFGYENVIEHLRARQDRERFKEGERSRMTPENKRLLVNALQDILGPSVMNLKLTFSVHAGCGMCPCSPGWCVSGEIVKNDWDNPLLAPALQMSSGRDKAVFYLNEDGTIEARGAVRTRASRRHGRDFTHPPIMTYLLHGKRIAPKAEVQAASL